MNPGEVTSDGPHGQHSRAKACVVAALSNGLYRLQLSDRRLIVGHVAQKMRMAKVALFPGEYVECELSLLDSTRARILSVCPRP